MLDKKQAFHSFLDVSFKQTIYSFVNVWFYRC